MSLNFSVPGFLFHKMQSVVQHTLCKLGFQIIFARLIKHKLLPNTNMYVYTHYVGF